MWHTASHKTNMVYTTTRLYSSVVCGGSVWASSSTIYIDMFFVPRLTRRRHCTPPRIIDIVNRGLLCSWLITYYSRKWYLCVCVTFLWFFSFKEDTVFPINVNMMIATILFSIFRKILKILCFCWWYSTTWFIFTLNIWKNN